jgi:hypothetical protein
VCFKIAKGYFPAVSTGWVVSKEGFGIMIQKISYLKLRGSWGQNGSDAKQEMEIFKFTKQ